MDIENEFLRESNAIEGEYTVGALRDAIKAWKFAKKANTIDLPLVLGIHERLMKRLNSEIAGNLRDYSVMVGGSVCLDHAKVKKELLKWCKKSFETEEDIKKLHIKFEKIHPFGDGNGRTGRILMNMQRLLIDLPVLVIHEGREQMEYYGWFK